MNKPKSASGSARTASVESKGVCSHDCPHPHRARKSGPTRRLTRSASFVGFIPVATMQPLEHAALPVRGVSPSRRTPNAAIRSEHCPAHARASCAAAQTPRYSRSSPAHQIDLASNDRPRIAALGVRRDGETPRTGNAACSRGCMVESGVNPTKGAARTQIASRHAPVGLVKSVYQHTCCLT